MLVAARLADSDEPVVTFRDSTEVHRWEQAKDLFMATTGHELRTPVTVIRGYAETLDRGWERLDEESRREAIRTLRDRAERLAVLVDRLLLADDGDRLAAVPAEFDLVVALRAAVAPLAAEGLHRLVVDLPAALPPALGDEASIRTVLSELVRNARKYSPDGGDITLTAAADERTVYFRVTDRGIGLAPDDLERAFDLFWQAEGSDRRRFGGVGLGLYLVRRIVEGQHGWVSLRPAPGRHSPDGTVAEVRLPRAGVTSGEA
jgi:two-component system, OmpR family, phosphate regulon sensor histidine kinase PhoR